MPCKGIDVSGSPIVYIPLVVVMGPSLPHLNIRVRVLSLYTTKHTIQTPIYSFSFMFFFYFHIILKWLSRVIHNLWLSEVLIIIFGLYLKKQYNKLTVFANVFVRYLFFIYYKTIILKSMFQSTYSSRNKGNYSQMFYSIRLIFLFILLH